MTNNNSKNGKNATFTFRSKFEKLVNDENRPIIVAAFEKFCSLDPKMPIAQELLWDLTYSPEVSSKALQELGLNQEIISPENVSKLRDELRHQYEKVNRGYLAVNVSEECIPAFEALSKKAGPIVASVVNELCSYRMLGYDVPRALFLLSSDKENFFFGGICDVGFTSKEAEYLKPFHMQIHDLLKAMYDRKQDASRNTPLSGLDSIIKDAGIELPFTLGEETQEAVEPETLVKAPVEAPADTTVQAPVEAPIENPNEVQAEQPVEPSYGFKELTTDAILEHKDVFAAFIESCDMNLLIPIGRFGFDLNKVVAKKDAIIKLFEAAKALND